MVKRFSGDHANGFEDVAAALRSRQWQEQQSQEHEFEFDLRWTCSARSIEWDMLQPGQKVNHFQGLHRCLTSKSGLLAAMSQCHFVSSAVNAEHFVPRAYDLSVCEEVHAFEVDFLWGCAEGVLKRLARCGGEEAYCAAVPEDVVQIAMQVLQAKLSSLIYLREDTEEDEHAHAQLPPNITDEQISRLQQAALDVGELGSIHTGCCGQRGQAARELLESTAAVWPQAGLDGELNIWILKPASASCGRGIGVAMDLEAILRHIASRGERQEGTKRRAAPRYRSLAALQQSGCSKWVAQKYIERPLLVKGCRKFDVRLWALVTKFEPLVAWIWQRPYIRFCAEDYSLTELDSVWRHLCNHAVTKQHTGELPEQMGEQCNMWHFDQMREYLLEQGFDSERVEGLQGAIEELAGACLECAAASGEVVQLEQSFELLGFDFMLDAQLQPWLIEVNSGPALDHSTPVTASLVPEMLSSLLDIVLRDSSHPPTQLGDTHEHWTCAVCAPNTQPSRQKVSTALRVQGTSLYAPGGAVGHLSAVQPRAPPGLGLPEQLPRPSAYNLQSTRRIAGRQIINRTRTAVPAPRRFERLPMPVHLAQPQLDVAGKGNLGRRGLQTRPGMTGRMWGRP